MSIIVSLLSSSSATCAAGFAEDLTFQVKLSATFCGGGHPAIGTYVDTGDFMEGEKVYMKSVPLQEIRFLYKVVTYTTPSSSTWYISSRSPFRNQNTGVYDIRWTIPVGSASDVTSIVNATTFAKCQSSTVGSGMALQSTMAIISQVADCKCDYNYGGDNNLCTKCVSGKYKTEISNKPCSVCRHDLQNAIIETCTCKPGSSGEIGGPCTQCLPGQYNEAGGSVACELCPMHMFSPANSDTKNMCTCNVGFTGPKAGPCKTCEAGKYKVSQGNASCTDCAVGQFSNLTGDTSSNVCKTCTSNSTSPIGSNNEAACVCLAGWSGENGTGCSKCGKDTFSNVSNSKHCTSCPTGQIAPHGGASQDACVCIMGSDAKCKCATASTELRELKVRVSGFRCFSVDIGGGDYIATGLVLNSSLVYHKVGPQARYQYKRGDEWYISELFDDLDYEIKFAGCRFTPQTVQELADIAFACRPAVMCGGRVDWTIAGNLITVSSTRCVCDTNFVRSSNAICTKCPAGSYKFIMQTGVSECRTCPANSDTFDPSLGIDGCGCKFGFNGPNTGECIKCEMGTYKPSVGPAACVKCPSNLHPLLSAFTVGNEVLNCNVCQIRFVWNTVTQECDRCASDEFNNKAGDSVCFKRMATPVYVPLTDNMIVWYKFDQTPDAWGPLLPGGPWYANGGGPGHTNKGLLFDSSVYRRHGYFVWNIHAKHPFNDRDTLNRQLFVEGDASFSSNSGHAAHLHG